MKQIDFLPSSYQEQSSQRKLKFWRAGVVALIGGTVVTAAVYQRHMVQQVELQLADLEPQHTAAAVIVAQLDKVNKDLQEANATAELYTYLRHPWPCTQILAALIAPVPDDIRFSELRLGRETLSTATERFSQPEPSLEQVAPAKQDLEKLRRAYDGSRLVVTVTGTTDAIAGLHEYLEKVRQSRIIEKASIKTIEAVPSTPGRLQFAAEFVVRQGYGQPGGPTPAEVVPSEATPGEGTVPVAAGRGTSSEGASS